MNVEGSTKQMLQNAEVKIQLLKQKIFGLKLEFAYTPLDINSEEKGRGRATKFEFQFQNLDVECQII